MSSKKLSRWSAGVIIDYNYPALSIIRHNDPLEQELWEQLVEYAIESKLGKHELCEERGWEFPPPEYWKDCQEDMR